MTTSSKRLTRCTCFVASAALAASLWSCRADSDSSSSVEREDSESTAAPEAKPVAEFRAPSKDGRSLEKLSFPNGLTGLFVHDPGAKTAVVTTWILAPLPRPTVKPRR